MCGKEGNWNQTRDHIKANHMSNVIIVKRPLQQEMATQKVTRKGSFELVAKIAQLLEYLILNILTTHC